MPHTFEILVVICAAHLVTIVAVTIVEVGVIRTDLHLRTLASYHLLNRSGHSFRRRAESVTVTIEENTLTLALSSNAGLNPLAPTSTLPDSLEEPKRATLGIGTVVLAHDLPDGIGSFVGVIERNNGYVVVKDVGLDDAVEESATDETKLTIDRGCGSASVCPGLCVVVRKSGISVLEVGDGDYSMLV